MLPCSQRQSPGRFPNGLFGTHGTFGHICANVPGLRRRKPGRARARNVEASRPGTQTMQLEEWTTKCERRFTDPDFAAFVQDQLATIRNAPTRREKGRLAGAFGGHLRVNRSGARLELAEAMMRELAVEPTQHVAYMLMKKAFGQAAETATLDRFAKPDRDASEKHMKSARAAAAAQPSILRRYASMYKWYVQRLDLHIARLKGKGARPRPRPGPSGAPSPAKSRPQLHRVK